MFGPNDSSYPKPSIVVIDELPTFSFTQDATDSEDDCGHKTADIDLMNSNCSLEETLGFVTNVPELLEFSAMYGGYPAVITSAEENAFIESVSSRAWIGGRVRFHGISNPTVEWITGEECTFTYWAFGAYNANDFPQWEGFPLTTAGVLGWNWRDPETYTEKSVICECEIEGNSTSALTFDQENIKLNCFSDSDIDGDGFYDYQELSSLDLGDFDKTTGEYKSATWGEYADKAIGVCAAKRRASLPATGWKVSGLH